MRRAAEPGLMGAMRCYKTNRSLSRFIAFADNIIRLRCTSRGLGDSMGHETKGAWHCALAKRSKGTRYLQSRMVSHTFLLIRPQHFFCPTDLFVFAVSCFDFFCFKAAFMFQSHGIFGPKPTKEHHFVNSRINSMAGLHRRRFFRAEGSPHEFIKSSIF